MLKTCSICGKIHDFNKVCKRPDRYLCKVCLSGKYDTNYRYTYKELEVHHIVPIEEDYLLKLDSNNLITFVLDTL